MNYNSRVAQLEQLTNMRANIHTMHNISDFYIRIYTGVIFNAVIHPDKWNTVILSSLSQLIPGDVHVEKLSNQSGLKIVLNDAAFTLTSEMGMYMLHWNDGCLEVRGSLEVLTMLQQLDSTGLPFLPSKPEYYTIDYLKEIAENNANWELRQPLNVWINRVIAEYIATAKE